MVTVILCVLFILSIIIAIILGIALSSSKRAKRDSDSQYNSLVSDYQDLTREQANQAETIKEYQRQEEKREADELEKKDKQKRRRVTDKIKQQVFDRDNRTCQICGISWQFLENICEGLGDYLLLETDHIVSVKNGGSGADIENLQCLCWRCNRTKGGKRTNEETLNSITWGVRSLTPRLTMNQSVSTKSERKYTSGKDADIYKRLADRINNSEV